MRLTLKMTKKRSRFDQWIDRRVLDQVVEHKVD